MTSKIGARELALRAQREAEFKAAPKLKAPKLPPKKPPAKSVKRPVDNDR